MARVVEVFGLVLFFACGSALDSESVLPMIGTLIGMAVLVLGYQMEVRR